MINIAWITALIAASLGLLWLSDRHVKLWLAAERVVQWAQAHGVEAWEQDGKPIFAELRKHMR